MLIIDWSSDVCSSDLAATRLAVDGKLSRPGFCNALETLLVHADIADKWLPDALATLARGGAGIRGCERTRALFADARPVTEEDYDTEYLAPIISVRVVDSIDDAIAHIQDRKSTRLNSSH